MFCSVPGESKGLTINEAVKDEKIIVQEASTSKDFESQESKVLKTRIPSVDLTNERLPPKRIYTVTGTAFLHLIACTLETLAAVCVYILM